MNLVWIEDLLAIAESQSLTEAAARRHVTQPAFSRRIRAIEEHLGVTLIDRSRRPARPIGAVLERVDLFRKLASGLRQLPRDLAASGAPADRRVVIACQHALSISVAPGLAKRVLESVDGATVRLRSANRDECVALLMTRQAHLLVALETDDLPVVADEDFVEKEHLADERLVAVAAPGSAAAVWSVDSPFDLPLIAYPDSVFLGAVMARHVLPSVALRGRHIRVVETALTLAARELAIAGIGAAWIPESLVRKDLDQGRLVHLSAALGGCVLALVVLRLRTPPSRAENIAWEAITRRDAAAPTPIG
ncbi:MAG: LysR family transcriptional regulator [Inquilinaceae bacterium]